MKKNIISTYQVKLFVSIIIFLISLLFAYIVTTTGTMIAETEIELSEVNIDDAYRDFLRRAKHPDVVMYAGFDSEPEVKDYVIRKPNHTNYDLTVWDSSISASGGGSMKMIIPNDQGIGGTNDWRRNFSDTSVTNPAAKFRGFGPNDLGNSFYIQWRQRFSLDHLNNYYKLSAGRGGWKLINIGDGDEFPWDYGDVGEAGSAQWNEIVMNNNELRLCPSVYHGNPGFVQITESINTAGQNYTDSNGELHDGYTFDEIFQNAIDKGPSVTNPFLRYPTLGAFRTSSGQFGASEPYRYTDRPVPPEYPAVCFHPDEWMTFQIGVTLGPLGTAKSSVEGSTPQAGWTNSRIEVWVGREGQPSVKIIDMSGITLRRGAGANTNDLEGYGKVWFTTFHTGLVADTTRKVGETWFDELIISRSRISDPGITKKSVQNPSNKE